jgi:hypothetical protein
VLAAKKRTVPAIQMIKIYQTEIKEKANSIYDESEGSNHHTAGGFVSKEK